MIVTAEGAVVGSIDRSALEEQDKTEDKTEDVAEVAPEVVPEVKPSMALTKEELVDLAEKAGLGERGDLEQFTKQDLVDELNANEGEG